MIPSDEIQKQLSELVDSVECGEAKNAVVKMVERGKEVLSPEQMNHLVEDLRESFSSINLGGSAEVIAVAAFAVFAKVSDMAPDIIHGSHPHMSRKCTTHTNTRMYMCVCAFSMHTLHAHIHVHKTC
jgi:hypothetical protein